MPTALEFWQEIEKLRRSVFKHHGRLPPNGAVRGRLDCVGPYFVAMQALGCDCPNFTGYNAQPDPAVLKRLVEERCTPRPWEEWDTQPGRLLVVRMAHLDIHVAFGRGDGWAVHVSDRWRLEKPAREQIVSVWLPKGISP
jgi:hypothetical protein